MKAQLAEVIHKPEQLQPLPQVHQATSNTKLEVAAIKAILPCWQPSMPDKR